MKHVMILLVALAISPLSQAGLVTFSWTNTNSNAQLLSGNGFWSMDASAITPSGFAEFAPLITNFEFNWTTIYGTQTLNPSNGIITSAAMSFSPQGNLLGYTICASAVLAPCGFSVSPSFEMIGGVGWAGTIPGDPPYSVVVGNTEVSQTYSDVPEPGPMLLLALGLLILACQHKFPLSRPGR